MIVPASVDEVAGGLRAVGYLPGESTALVSYLAARLGKPVLVEGPAGGGKTGVGVGGGGAVGGRRGDGAGEGAGEAAGAPARAPAVLRGPRRGQGAVRVELPQAAPAHTDRGPGHRLERGAGRHLRRGVPPHPPAPAGDLLRGARRAAHRRDRQNRP